MAGEHRRTPEEKAECIDFAKRLLDLGASQRSVVAQLQRRFGISRSAAYRDSIEAADERGSEHIYGNGGMNLRLTAQIVEQALLTASMDNDLKEISRLAKVQMELHKAMGMAMIRAVTGDTEVGGGDDSAEHLD